MLGELGVTVLLLKVILMDNLGASFFARNPIAYSRLKHVALDLFFDREKTEEGTLVVKHIVGSSQWADVLTKALPPRAFRILQTKLVGEPPSDEPPSFIINPKGTHNRELSTVPIVST